MDEAEQKAVEAENETIRAIIRAHARNAHDGALAADRIVDALDGVASQLADISKTIYEHE